MRNINSLKGVPRFKKVYTEGKAIANRHLVLYVLPEQGDFRLGISVSKKVGNSVVRHRVTRLIRESYLAYKPQLPCSCHMVAVARSAARGQDLETIRSSFGHLLEKHGLI